MFNEPFQLKHIYKQIKESLKAIYEANEAESISKILLDSVISDVQIKLISDPELLINRESVKTLFEKTQELKQNKPIQYVLGETEFMGSKFIVNEHVLIPRSETEELVSWILELDLANKVILDIGTGSGCIPVTLAKKGKKISQMTAMDISNEALSITKKNSELNYVNIKLVRDDILKPKKLYNTFDIIVSNPPYVKNSEKSQMAKNVLDFEPEIALFVNDDDPLQFYKAIVNFSVEHLKNAGLLFFEINENLGGACIDLFRESGFVNIELRKDLNGKDRMIKAQKTL